ncbi:hypothetical protein M9Y10_043848 [Tritrichomonas musculus]|uniref:Spindle assembly abnormal protein 6 N-terminal domain-containing protein n=1 Tax=Tritrichomonas musculus TaxID=1915356 RepID=A0ABR2K1G3_9EUKA
MSEEESFNTDEFQHPLLLNGFKLNNEQDLIINDADGNDKLYHIQIYFNDEEEDHVCRIEITVESDIYSILRFEVTQNDFPEFVRTQPFKKLKFEDFTNKLTRALDNVRTNRSSFSAVFSDETEDGILLTIKQQLEFKRVDIFKLHFHHLDDNELDYLNQQAQYRYSYKLSQYDNEVRMLNDLFDHIRERNPKLCEQLLKGSKFGQK